MKSNMAGACLGVKYFRFTLLMCEQLAEITTCRDTQTHIHTEIHTNSGVIYEGLKNN